MVPQPFTAGENWSYPEFWTVIGDPRYPGNFTPTADPEPSVEQVALAGHSKVGRTISHMVLWALPWDSAVRLRG
jgi:hypothetical protein